MNNKVKEEVLNFSAEARQLLEEQKAQLMSVKDDLMLSGKLAKMKVFNEHHEALKQKLKEKMDATIVATKGLTREQHHKLDSGLKNVYAECINDYLCIPFVKDKD